MYKEVTEKIVSILESYSGLNSGAHKISKFAFGQPVKYDLFPLIYVEWAGDVSEEKLLGGDSRRLAHIIGVVDRHVDIETARKSVMDKCELVKSALEENPTLDGLVDGIEIGPVSSIVETMLDYSQATTTLTLFSYAII